MGGGRRPPDEIWDCPEPTGRGRWASFEKAAREDEDVSVRESSVLAIEVGNSRIKAGLFGGDTQEPLPVLLRRTFVGVEEESPATRLYEWLGGGTEAPETLLIGGVNPRVIERIVAEWRDDWGVLTRIERPSEPVLVNRTDVPERVGVDRLFDAVAANRIRPEGTPAIVIDSGTATTVNFIDQEGAFCGGSILAGIQLISTALHERTALLPKVDARELKEPPDAVGRNTETAIRSGLYWSLVGGVKEIVGRMTERVASDGLLQPIVLLTGGMSPLLVRHLPQARLESALTLQGMVVSAGCGRDGSG